MPRPDRFYNLNRPKLRQSWNKYNLYNLYKNVGKHPGVQSPRTFFQQKWAAKSSTRAFHGEHIREKKWERMFSRRLMSAVNMSPKYLAAHDGSEQAAGRGSGLSTTKTTAETYSSVPSLTELDNMGRPGGKRGMSSPNGLLEAGHGGMTPYMHMTYAPLERRLDTAVYRALFASSIRQARQFVVHGGVKVNGKKMGHPAYLLNPGDMFQVDVEKVMYGTGAQKNKSGKPVLEGIAARERREKNLAKSSSSKEADSEGKEADSEGVEAAAEGEDAAAEATDSLTPEQSWETTNKKLKFLLKDVKKILARDGRDLSANDKKRLRFFRTSAARFLSHGEESNAHASELLEDLMLQMRGHETMRETFEKFNLEDGGEPTSVEEKVHNREAQIAKGFQELNEEQKEKAKRIMGDSRLSNQEMRQLATLLMNDEENPVDDSKPYATPWRPRPYMPAFAFIPRYLEVNPKICAAVYLRHPVARKGLAEVPTPFSYLTSQLAHNWYLRRG